MTTTDLLEYDIDEDFSSASPNLTGTKEHLREYFLTDYLYKWICQKYYDQGNAFKLTQSQPEIKNELPNQSGIPHFCIMELNWGYNYFVLSNLLDDENSNYGHYFEEGLNSHLPRIHSLFDQIAKMDYEKSRIEFTPEKSIFIKLNSGHFSINIELYLNISEGNQAEAFFTVFKGSKCIINGMGTIEEAIHDVMEIV